MLNKLWTFTGVFLFIFIFVGGIIAVNQPILAQNQNPASKVTKAASGGGTGIDAVDKTLHAVQANDANNTLSSEAKDNGTYTNIMSAAFLGAVGTPKSVNGTVSYTGGVFGTMQGLIVAMVDKPVADPNRYMADVLHSAGIVEPVYAQGLGFAALDPVLEVWKIFRNIAYFFLIVAMLIIGIAIMLRQKIGSQTVITAQQAIPSIIIALLAITFSYAIAGLLIDLMYVIMYLLVGLFGKSSTTLIDGNFLQLGMHIVGGATDDVATSVSQFVNDTLGGGILSNLAGIAGGVTAAVIFAVAIIIGIFRLFLNLLRRYIAIVISVALAPVILMVGAVPGKNTFSGWLKGLIGNLAAFPILLIALIIIDTLTHTLTGAGRTIESGGFLPPYLGGVGTSGSLVFIVGLGGLLVLSEIVDKGTEAFGAGKSPFDSLVEAAQKNFRGGIGGVNRAIEAQPFNAYSRNFLRTTGKESMVERLLVGSRSQRKDEFRLSDQAAALGGEYKPKMGGIAAAVNARRAKAAARRQSGGGAGDALDVEDLPEL